MKSLKLKQKDLIIQVEQLQVLYDSKRAQLQENDTFNQLSSLESKLKVVEGQTFGMRDCKLFHYIISTTHIILYRYCVQDKGKRL